MDILGDSIKVLRRKSKCDKCAHSSLRCILGGYNGDDLVGHQRYCYAVTPAIAIFYEKDCKFIPSKFESKRRKQPRSAGQGGGR